jgi:hypothetical protein
LKQLQFSFIEDHPAFKDLSPKIVRAFWAYHEANPHIFPLIVRFARQVREAGRSRYSVVAIFERIRWHLTVETKGDDFKLNNNYRSCYSRLLALEHPEFEGFFETRQTPGTKGDLD